MSQAQIALNSFKFKFNVHALFNSSFRFKNGDIYHYEDGSKLSFSNLAVI